MNIQTMFEKQRLAALILSCVWLCTVAEIPDPELSNSSVLDIDGKPLVPGAQYHIWPAIPDRGGALTFVTRNKGSICPKNVGQANEPGLEGTPVRIISESNSPTIKEGWNVRIAFQGPTSCPQSTMWSLDGQDSVMMRRLVDLNARVLYQASFKIVNLNGFYHLHWCPENRNGCGTAGITIENGVRLLALDGLELPIVFQKVQ